MKPGDVLTADLSGGVGAEKDKERPVVVVHVGAQSILVSAMTDAGKSRIPTHHFVPAYSSGTQIKDALVTTEHSWSVDPARLAARAGAAPLQPVQIQGAKTALRKALGLHPIPTPKTLPPTPAHRRGELFAVDFTGAQGVEAQGVLTAVVLSNDVGNGYGRTLLVAPVVDAAQALWGVPIGSGAQAVDVGRLRVVDTSRVSGGRDSTLSKVELSAVDAALLSLTA